MDHWLNLALKFFFLLTPFYVLTSFISMTADFSAPRRRLTALKMTAAIIIICLVFFFLGQSLFQLFDITLHSFRMGTGVLLLLTAIQLARGVSPSGPEGAADISVVPLAIPITVGPGTIGALLVLSAEVPTWGAKLTALTAVMAAILATGALCLVSGPILKLIRQGGLTVLTRLTGLVIAAIGSQMIIAGVKGSW